FQIEARVQYCWDPRSCFEALDQIIIPLVLISCDRLDPRATIDVHRGSNFGLLSRLHLEGQSHEWCCLIVFERRIACRLANRRWERAPILAELHSIVAEVPIFHVPWIGKDRAVAKRARPKLFSPLVPPD